MEAKDNIQVERGLKARLPLPVRALYPYRFAFKESRGQTYRKSKSINNAMKWSRVDVTVVEAT